MATVESGQFAINLIGSQAQELLLKPIFFDANVEEIFDTMVLVNKKQNLAYADTMVNLLQNTNTCGWTPKGNFAIFDRCIETELVKANVELCYDEFADTVYKQLMKKGTSSRRRPARPSDSPACPWGPPPRRRPRDPGC